MPYVYILRCRDGSYYVGSTVDLEKRVWQHNQGLGGDYTASHRPVELVFSEHYASVADAFALERKLHGWSRAKKEALIRSDWDAIKVLARNRQADATP